MRSTELNSNKELWEYRAEIHPKTDFYNLENVAKGETSLNEIELEILGNISEKSLIHLQCHFGLDTLSLARLGAKVHGIDFSEKAIIKAKELSEKWEVPADFTCCSVYDVSKKVASQFDIVFTSYGTISWIDDLNKWAKEIYTLLKSGGELIFVEFHPVVWMFDDAFTEVAYPYFNERTLIETSIGTYADSSDETTYQVFNWNHSMSEVVNSLIQTGMKIELLNEYDYSPYNVFQGAVEASKGKYRIGKLKEKIPMVYAIKATKNG